MLFPFLCFRYSSSFLRLLRFDSCDGSYTSSLDLGFFRCVRKRLFCSIDSRMKRLVIDGYAIRARIAVPLCSRA